MVERAEGAGAEEAVDGVGNRGRGDGRRETENRHDPGGGEEMWMVNREGDGARMRGVVEARVGDR